MSSTIPENISSIDQIFDFDFHPSFSILATGLINGKVEIWNYSSSGKNTLQQTYPLFQQSCRSITFNQNGNQLFTISSDQSWKIIDTNTGNLVEGKKAAHKHPINKLLVINDQLFLTGDDNGIVKLWDQRSSSQFQESMSWDAHNDYITAFEAAEDGHTVLSTGGDATLCVYDIRNQAHFYKSDDQESELHSLKIVKNGRKVYCGTQEGAMVIFKWGEWEDCVDRFIGHPDGIECMVKLDETTLITGSMDSSIRLVSLQPKHKIEGVIGDLGGMSVEGLKLNREKSLLASISTDEILRFWDISEFIDGDDDNDDDDAEGDEDDSSNAKPEDSVSESDNNNNSEEDDPEEEDDGNLIPIENVEDSSAGEGEDGDEESEEEEEEEGKNEERLQSNNDDDSESEDDDDEEGSDSEDSNRRPKKRIKTSREKFYDDL